MPNLAYFITDYYEKLYDDSLETLTMATPTLPTPSLLTTSPTILSAHSSPNLATSLATASLTNVKTSPPLVLKISTRKLEIIASIKLKTAENELCSVLFLYLVAACVEINDWINLKVLLPALRYPKNNELFFERFFLFQFFNMLVEKSVIEQFKHDWFVTLIFDDFLFVLLQQKDAQAGANPAVLNSSNLLYDQIYKLIDRLYPNHLFINNFTRFIELVKPKKMVSFLLLFIITMKIKLKNYRIDI